MGRESREELLAEGRLPGGPGRYGIERDNTFRNALATQQLGQAVRLGDANNLSLVQVARIQMPQQFSRDWVVEWGGPQLLAAGQAFNGTPRAGLLQRSRVVLKWGVGGVQFEARWDWARGGCVTVRGSYVELDVLVDFPNQLTNGDVAAPAVANIGAAGATTYGYAIVGITPSGTHTRPIEGLTLTGNAILTGVNFNRITWVDSVGGFPSPTSFEIHRTRSDGTPATTGLIGTVLPGVQTFDDTGLAVLGVTPEGNNTEIKTVALGAISPGTAARPTPLIYTQRYPDITPLSNAAFAVPSHAASMMHSLQPVPIAHRLDFQDDLFNTIAVWDFAVNSISQFPIFFDGQAANLSIFNENVITTMTDVRVYWNINI